MLQQRCEVIGGIVNRRCGVLVNHESCNPTYPDLRPPSRVLLVSFDSIFPAQLNLLQELLPSEAAAFRHCSDGQFPSSISSAMTLFGHGSICGAATRRSGRATMPKKREESGEHQRPRRSERDTAQYVGRIMNAKVHA